MTKQRLGPIRKPRPYIWGRWFIVVLGALLIGAVLLTPIYQSDSPVVSRSTISAVVKSIYGVPQGTRGGMPLDSSYRYMVVMEQDGTTTFLSDSVAKPHPIGSTILIERRTHKNGTVTYHMTGPAYVDR